MLGTHRGKAAQKWTFIYQVTSAKGLVVYVGKTVDEHRRSAAHQRRASGCKLLAAFIEWQREASPSWKFAEHFSRVPGLEYGVPADHADMWEAYCIMHARQGSSLSCNPANQGDKDSPPCNMLPGTRLSEFTAEVAAECARKLRNALHAGSAVYSPTDMLEWQRANSVADKRFLRGVVRAADEENIRVPEVRQCYELAVLAAKAARPVLNIQELIQAQLREYRPKAAEFRSDAFARTCNVLDDMIRVYAESSHGPAHCKRDFYLRRLKWTMRAIKGMNGNGEEAVASKLDKDEAVDMLALVCNDVKSCESAGTMKPACFNGIMAWSNPSTKFVEKAEVKLSRLEARLTGASLSAPQQARAAIQLQRLRDSAARGE